MTGLRPIAELMYIDFFGMSMDQIINQLAKFAMFGGQISAPLVLRTQGGTGRSAGAQRSQVLIMDYAYSWFIFIYAFKAK